MAKYGGSPSDVNADVAEGYAVGQVAAQAVTATKGTDNAKIITYLHSGVTLTSVQGPVRFDNSGKNSSAAAFTFQWQQQGTAYKQILPASTRRLGGDHQPQAELDQLARWHVRSTRLLSMASSSAASTP